MTGTKFSRSELVQTVANFLHIGCKSNHVQMPVYQFFIQQIDPGLSWIAPEHRPRVLEILGIMGPPIAVRNNGG